MLDNHMVHGAQAELDKKGQCPNCNRLLVLIDWCEENREKCCFCKGDDDSTDCLNKVEKLWCDRCEIILEVE